MAGYHIDMDIDIIYIYMDIYGHMDMDMDMGILMIVDDSGWLDIIIKGF